MDKIKLSVSEFPSAIGMLTNYLKVRCNTFKAGNVSTAITAWQNITSDAEILRTVNGTTIEFDTLPINIRQPQIPFSSDESNVIDQEIAKLLAKDIIEVTKHTPDEVVSNIFIRPKKDGTHRLILNLKGLNQFVTYHHFKMDTLHSILKLVERNCFMASLDLKDAYYSVAVNRSDRKYLRFIWQGILYQFTCLPNGLSSCPRTFTKLLKPPLTVLHKLGHITASYIDDLFLQGKTYEQCVSNVLDTFLQFEELGFIIHPDKSAFIPSQELVLLGFIINSIDMTIILTPEKKLAIKQLCLSLISKHMPTIREVAQVIGKIISSFPGVTHGPLYYRAIERNKTEALKIRKGNFDKRMTLSEDSKIELQWWAQNVIESKNVISHGHPSCTLTTDASLTGWGAVYKGSSTGGFWSDEETSHHINYLELLALHLGLRSYCKGLHDTHIRAYLDNTTAIAVINHMGTSHSPQSNTLGKTIWEWCIARNIWLSAAHIPGVDNTIADSESRSTNIHTEWMIDRSILKSTLTQFGFQPNIDIFATRLNAQFPTYVSYRPDPDAFAIDALSLNLSNLQFYAFPPFSVIATLLQKIQEDKATGIVVIPDWPTQSWYAKAIHMCLQPPIRLNPGKRLLQLPGQPQGAHPLHKTLALLVCLLSGNS